MLAAGSHKRVNGAYEESVSIFAKENEDWREIYQFTTNEKFETPSSILDVSWALRHGRQFHYILACSTTGIYIFKLTFDYGGESHETGAPVRTINVLDIKFIPNTPGIAAIRGAWNYMVGSSVHCFRGHEFKLLNRFLPEKGGKRMGNRTANHLYQIIRSGYIWIVCC